MFRFITLFALVMVVSAIPHYSHNSRCAALFDESCINGGVEGGNNEAWLGGNGAGKRDLEMSSVHPGFFKHLSNFFDRVHMVASKRCANLFDESCANPGPGGESNEEWLGGNPAGR